MEEILATAKDELQESVLNGVSQVIHNDEVSLMDEIIFLVSSAFAEFRIRSISAVV